MTSLRVTISSSLVDIPCTVWNPLAAEAGLYASHEWLRTVEADIQGQCRYVVVHDGAQAVGALPVYLLANQANPYYTSRFFFPDLPTNGDLDAQAGTVSGYQSEPLIAEGLAEPRRSEIARALLGAATDVVAEHSDHLCFLYLTGRGLARVADYAGARPMLSYGGDAWLVATGATFAEHLASLRSKRRWVIRDDMRRFASGGLRVTVERPVDHIEVVIALQAQAQAKYDTIRPVAAETAALERQLAALGDRASLFLCRSGPDVVGMALAYEWHGWLYVRTAGFDYGRLSGAAEYFNVVIHEPLRYCIEHGLRGIHLGTGSHRAKALRGARIDPLAFVALAVDGTPLDDAAPPSARRAVRRYWDQQLVALPKYFDRDIWGPLLDRCSPPAPTRRPPLGES